MSHYHAVVWLDHSEAHVMHISREDVENRLSTPPSPMRTCIRKAVRWDQAARLRARLIITP